MRARWAFFGLWLWLCLCWASPLAHAKEVNIKALRLAQNTERLRAVFDLDAPLALNEHKITILHNPERMVLDIYRTNTPSVDKFPPRGSFLDKLDMLYSIRMGHDSQRLRVVFDLNYPATVKSFILPPEKKSQSHRLVLDISPQDAKVKLQNGGSALPPVLTAPPTATAAVPIGSNAPATRSPTTTAHKTQKPKKRDLVVAIDPGHGGSDSGAAYFGYKEKDIVLNISRQLVNKINSIDGMRAVLTRNSDIFVPVRQRWSVARKNKADVLVSIHADAAPSFSIRGADVYVLDQYGQKDEANVFLERSNGKRRYLEGENDYIGNISLKDQSDQMTEVLLDLAQASTVEQSLRIGERVRSELAKVVTMHGNHVKRESLEVLRGPDMPSILIETGFLSNREEAKELNQPSRQQKTVNAIATGLMKYYQEYPLPGTHVGSK